MDELGQLDKDFWKTLLLEILDNKADHSPLLYYKSLQQNVYHCIWLQWETYIYQAILTMEDQLWFRKMHIVEHEDECPPYQASKTLFGWEKQETSYGISFW